MIHYNIHGIIDVFVNPKVNDSILNNIDFQIGYFKKKTNREQLTAQKIIIEPYDNFIPDPTRVFNTFHLVQGISGQCLDYPSDRLAFESCENCYMIYADKPNFLINIFIQLLIIEHGIAMVHAAAVADKNGCVTLLPGAGGVGKTALLGDLVKHHNYKTLGDDIICLTESGECLSFPRSFVLKEYHRPIYPEAFNSLNHTNNKFNRFKLMKLIMENIPFLGLTKATLRRMGLLDNVLTLLHYDRTALINESVLALPVEDVLGQGTVVDRGNIKRIVFLQRYAGTKLQLVPIDEDELCSRMFAIILHEWVDVMRQFFTMGALELVDLPSYFNRIDDIIRNGISEKKCHILLIPDTTSPQEMSRYFIETIGDI